jgi:hypothetical protein
MCMRAGVVVVGDWWYGGWWWWWWWGGGGQRVAEAGAIPHLVSLLKVNDSFAQSQVLLAPALRLQHE